MIHGPISRAKAKKINEYDDSLAKGMSAFIVETMKNILKNKSQGFEDERKPLKLHIVIHKQEVFNGVS